MEFNAKTNNGPSQKKETSDKLFNIVTNAFNSIMDVDVIMS
jgi:hypothetical protein